AQGDDVIKALAGFVSKTNASKVIIAMDADEAGMRASGVLLRRLSGLNVRVAEIDYNTVRNELTLLGSEQFGIDDYVIAMKRAGKLSVSNAIPLVRRLKPVSVAKIVGQSQSFLFEPLIPMGVMTIIEGNPGCGKSFLTIGMSCSVATGKPLYLGENVLTPSVSGNVLVFSCEDSPTVVSIRTAMLYGGSRPDNIYYEFEPFDMVKSLDEVEDLVQMYKPKLVIIDPLMNYMGACSDVYRDNAVRAVLTPYTKMASKHGFAFVVVRHLRKNAGDATAVCRGIGSIGFSGLARCVLSLEQDENGIITVSVAKHSYMPIRTSFSYTIGDMRVG
ncbi:MAG: AAA family ATPase, partial [Nitrososphaerales archaeon]